MSDSELRAGGGLPATPTAPADAPPARHGQDDRPAPGGPRPAGAGPSAAAPDAAAPDAAAPGRADLDGAAGDGTTPDAEAGADEAGADEAGTPRRRRRGRAALWWTPVVVVVVAGLLAAGAALGDLIDRAPGESSVDVGFARDMSEHHAQAVQMAMIEFDRGGDASTRSVAQDIALTQQREIGVMSAWLSGWGRAQTTGGPPMRWMGGTGKAAGTGHDAHGGTGSAAMGDMPGMNGTADDAAGTAGDTARMPGMATPTELRRLATIRGRDLDVLFLTLMVHHHRGGLAMAQYAAQHADQDRTRSVARAMVLNQSIEIDQMQQDLVRLGAPRA
ncbi:DUF305 domain-containing protein [Frankia sp. QA3]|uniref:DUF305 domain-containing protein n=1 Tax=Frankia sp. QA3 TaxID=710111 RepID=UPI000269CBE2|nr:DUF305 domain-containing protein [Frankia sp. QA3]EIV95531.1 hypothetical protein FraQA3DRAFT_5367 [Frankia sp. QA3]